MSLREEYIRNKKLAGIPVNESADAPWEYQLRDISGVSFYKRRRGDKIWEFTTMEDFVDNFKGVNLVKWNEKH